MEEKRIFAIREIVFSELAIAEDNFESAALLYEAEKYWTSIHLFRKSLQAGIKALLILNLDDFPDNSHLIETYYQTGISQQIKLGVELDEILNKISKVERENVDHPLRFNKESIQDLDICHKQIEHFLGKARKIIKKSLLTTKEIKRKKYIKKIVITVSASIVTILVLIKIILFSLSLGKGLSGDYFADRNFNKLIKTRDDRKINFNWGKGNIIKNYSDDVSIRWMGKIKAPKNGLYTFVTQCDDGERLWIDDKLIIDDWKENWSMINRVKITLEKGYHGIKIEYFEADEGAFMKLMWILPGKNKEKVISPSYLKPDHK